MQAILDGEIDSFTDVAESSGPFTYFHKGSLAYLGGPCMGVGFRVLGFRVQGFLAQNLCGRRPPKQQYVSCIGACGIAVYEGLLDKSRQKVAVHPLNHPES